MIAQHGMVATSHPLAAQVGLDILKNGGNAIDAAIATNAAMGLMEPTGNGIDGDLFALVWDAETRQVYALNASGRSPRSLTFEALITELERLGKLNPTDRTESGYSDQALTESRIPPSSFLSVSVPGAVDGWFTLHERFGSTPMAEILALAIAYAENGFPVPELIADAWQRSARFLANRPGAFQETFTIEGRGPEKEEIVTNPDLGHTFRLLAQEGRDAFYRGEIAQKIDAYMRENGGHLRLEDLAAHRSDWIEPLSSSYRGYHVYQIGQNNQGTAVLQMLNILEGFDLASMGFQSPEAMHVMIEAKKLAFEDRAKYYSDPAFNELPFDRLISKEYARERASLIDMDRAMESVSSGVNGLAKGGTIYLTTADAYGNMVSLIQSNFRGMGTGFVAPGTGFSFQNRGELFSLDPKHPNVYALGHRVEVGGGFSGRYQGIRFDPRLGVYFGASESRADGQAVGY